MESLNFHCFYLYVFIRLVTDCKGVQGKGPGGPDPPIRPDALFKFEIVTMYIDRIRYHFLTY